MQPAFIKDHDISSDNIFETTFSLLPDPALIMDDKGIIVAANQSFLEAFKLKPENVEGNIFFKLIHTGEVEEEQIRQILQRGMKDTKVIRFEAYIPIGDEAGIWAIVDSRFFQNQGKTLCVSVLNDISDRKKIEEDLRSADERIKNFMDNANDLIQSVSSDGSIIYVNKTWLSTLGYKEEDLPDLNIADIIRNDQIPHCFKLMDAVKRGEKFECVETVFKARDGREIYVEGNISGHFEYGKFIATRGIFRNITKRKLIEETYSLLIRNFPAPIYITQDGIFRFVNPSFQAMTEYSENELIGMEALKLVHPEEMVFVQRNSLRMLRANKPASHEFRLIRKSGEVRWVIETIISIPYEGGRAALGTYIDLTERKLVEDALEESKVRYQTLFSCASDAIYIHNMQTNKILEVNDAACALFGYSRAEFLKLPVTQLVPLSGIPEFERHKKEFAEKGYLIAESENISHAGKLIPVEIHGRLVDYEKTKAALIISRDITERKQAIEELEKANKQLRELDKLKDNFLSTVSHELRTPLTSIKSFAEILLSYDEDRATQKEFLGIINEESDRLTRLINDFLDLSKIQAGRMQWKMEAVSLLDSIRSATNAIRPLIEKSKLELSMDIEAGLPQVMSDRDRLVQVITNLLGNAVKFTPEGGKITIKTGINKDNPEKQMLITSISDTGIGIAPEHHQSIFEKFGQVGDVLKDRPKGTGLGLPICKKIIENFGGKIWVESALGKGTTFLFSLPVDQGKNNLNQ